MPNPFEKEYNIIVEALQEAVDKINVITNPDVLSLKNKVVASLQRDINALGQRANRGDTVPATTLRRDPPPLMRYLGSKLPDPNDRKQPEIRQAEKLTFSKFKDKMEETTEDVQIKELIMSVDRLYPEFLNMESDKIRDAYSDIEIQGVAKKAGLPVTEKTPINLKFIDQVKDAIKKKIELEKKTEEQKKRIDEAK